MQARLSLACRLTRHAVPVHALQCSNASQASAHTTTSAQAPSLPLALGKLHCWYADHQEVILPDGHRFPMDKYRATRTMLQQETQVSALTEFYPSPAVPMEDLCRVHTTEYVDRFVSGALQEKDMRAIGFPWTPSVVCRNLASVGGTLAATKALLAQPGLRMTAHVSGGTHHAFAHAGEGFCVFNDIAVAASHALAVGGVSSILVVDLDVHQGNGTAEIFEEEPRVVTFDAFCNSNYPWKTRRTNTYDVPLRDDVTDAEYLDMLGSNLEMLKKHKPELVFYQAGVDSLAEDSLGRMSLSRSALSTRNNMVYSFALEQQIPLVITMGGGYAKPDISPSVQAHADVYRAAAFRLGAFQKTG